MPIDLSTALAPALLGFAAAALPLLYMAWSLQRRLASQQLEFSLLQERLNNAQLAQTGLAAQLDDCREEVAEISEIKADQQAELAALRREPDLLQQERQIAREAAQAWSNQREQQEAEIRRLDAQRAALSAELNEQQDSHQQRLNDLQGSRDELRAQFAELAGKIFDEREQRFAETSQQRLGQLLDPLKERIQSFEKRVEESYQQEARERFSLGKELERLLEHAGLEKGREYQTQVSLKSPDGQRFQPDVLIRLPGDRQVVVDAKVSLTAYQQYIAAEDDASRQLLLKQHVLSLRSHLKGLSLKDYQRLEGLHSLDFVLLFVPIEAAFAAALQADPGLFQEAFDQHIVIVSPTTLLATLRGIESLWRQERQRQTARGIAGRAGGRYDKFA